MIGSLTSVNLCSPPRPLIPTLCDSKLMPPLAPLSHTMVLKQRLVPSDSWLSAETWLPPRHTAATAVKSHWALMKGFPINSQALVAFWIFASCWIVCLLGAQLLLQLSMFCLQPVLCELHSIGFPSVCGMCWGHLRWAGCLPSISPLVFIVQLLNVMIFAGRLFRCTRYHTLPSYNIL